MAGRIGRTVAESTPEWPESPRPPKGAPNILVVLFDDVGFSDFGCHGSPIRTPNIDFLPVSRATSDANADERKMKPDAGPVRIL